MKKKLEYYSKIQYHNDMTFIQNGDSDDSKRFATLVNKYETEVCIALQSYSGKDYLNKMFSWACKVTHGEITQTEKRDAEEISHVIQVLDYNVHQWIKKNEYCLSPLYISCSFDNENGSFKIGNEQQGYLLCSLKPLLVKEIESVQVISPTYINLYYYTSNETLEKICKYGDLKVSHCSYCNDIYEFLPAWESEGEKKTILKIYNDMEQVMLCLSKSADSAVMWGHYADHARGAIISFRMPVYRLRASDNEEDTLLIIANNEEELQAKIVRQKEIILSEVKYTPDRPAYKPAKSYYEYCGFTSTKGSEWAYEEEIRIVFNRDEFGCRYDKERKGYFASMIMPYIDAIILGPRNEKSIAEMRVQMQNWIDSNSSINLERISIHKAEYQNRKYNLKVPAENLRSIRDIPLYLRCVLGSPGEIKKGWTPLT